MTFRTWCTVIALCAVCSSTALAQTSGNPVSQGNPAGGANAWPVLVTEDTTNTKVKPGDATNKAIRVNCVTGCSGGGGGGGVVTGNKTNDAAAPSTDNIGALTALAGSSPPSYTNGRLVLPSVDLGGSLRVLLMNSTVAVTQSGAWTVTANAGTNLNTSALLLESTFGRTQGSATAGQTGPLVQGAVTTSAPSYTTAQTSPLSLTLGGLLRVDAGGATVGVSQVGSWGIHGLIAADALLAGLNPLAIGFRASAAAPADVSADGDAVWPWALRSGALAVQPTFAGVLQSTGNGTAGTGTPRVTIASDNTAFSVNVGTFPDNEPINVAQMNGTAVTMGNGASGTGVQRVTIANDSTGIVNQGGTWTVQPGNTQNTTEWLTKPTPRTVASANNTGTCTSVGTSSTTVLASNASRKAYGFKAPSTNSVVVFCKLGATATTSNVPFEAGSAWNQDTGAVYTGVVDCITASSTANVCVFEFN